jgi:hypothetical protein
MNGSRIPRPAVDIAIRNRLVDEAIERYVEWREECARVETAYRCWSNAGATEWTISFAIYHAALDREECAARVYSGAVSRLTQFLWRGAERDPPSSRAA